MSKVRSWGILKMSEGRLVAVLEEGGTPEQIEVWKRDMLAMCIEQFGPGYIVVEVEKEAGPVMIEASPALKRYFAELN